jgi:hypothetical protein
MFEVRAEKCAYSCAVFCILLAMNILSSCRCLFAFSETRSFRSKIDINCLDNLAIEYQRFVDEGDIITSGSETRIIDSEYHLIGNIIVKDNSTLIIRNTIFNQTSGNGRVGIVIENRASFIVTNATLALSQDSTSKITVQDEAKFDMVDSTIANSKSDVYIWVRENSTLQIENSAISSFIESKLVIESSSKVNIKDSTLGRVVVWRNPEVLIESSTITGALKNWGTSTVRVSGSTVGLVIAYGNLTMYIRNSIIGGDVTTGLKSDVWLIHTSAQDVSAGGNSRVWLIDASVEAFHEHGDAAVFVGWDVPLFGPMAVHCTLVPMVRLITLIVVGATAFIVLFIVIRKLHKRRQVAPTRGSDLQ